MTNAPSRQGPGVSIEEFRTTRLQWANANCIDHEEAYLGLQIEEMFRQKENLMLMPRLDGNVDLECLDYEITTSINAFLAKDFGNAQLHFTEAEKWREALRPE